MRIDCLPVTGSPRGIIPADLYGRGVGGSEKMIIELLSLLAKEGNNVFMYNDPSEPGNYDGVNYLPNFMFDPNIEDRVILLFRGYDERVKYSKSTKVIGLSTDQYTNEFDYGVYWYPVVNKMIGISDFHRTDHIARYGKIAEKMRVIDIGLNTDEYKEDLEKVPYQCIYSSVPDRGLIYLCDYWPEIKTKVPEATLIITSDYRLWGSPDPNNMQYRLKFAGMQGVRFLGKITRNELIEFQKKSEVAFHPCNYHENFCMAIQEAQAGGCFPITSNVAALETTNQTFGKIDNHPHNKSFKMEFIDKTVEFLNIPIETRKEIQSDIKFRALNRFGWDKIVKEWMEVLND